MIAAPGEQVPDLGALLHGDVFTVAQRLLGARVRTRVRGAPTEVMLTEVEAYAGADDPASHAYRGRTARNGAMFGPSGHLYVYRSYGIHWCMNVVVGDVDLPHAVLLRGGEITEGIGTIERRRRRRDNLTNGPGKLCEALAVTGDHDGSSLVDGPVRLIPGSLPEGSRVLATPRIGISKAVEHHWRYVAVG